MPKHGRGRPGRSLKGAVSQSLFDIDQFRSILNQIGGNPVDWSLKDQWRRFYKLYFCTKYARDDRVKTAYFFFKKNLCALTLDENNDPHDLPMSSLNSNETGLCTPPLVLSPPSSPVLTSPLDDQLSQQTELNSSVAHTQAAQTTAHSVADKSGLVQLPKLEHITNSVVLINCGNIPPHFLTARRIRCNSGSSNASP